MKIGATIGALKSIFFWQQNTGRRPVCFRNYPNLDARNTECVDGHQPESCSSES
jgi:hypothetical protein